MSHASVQFIEKAREIRVVQNHPRVTQDGQATFFKFCPVCHEPMPHVRKEDYSECVLCGNRTYRNSQSKEGTHERTGNCTQTDPS
jgi:rRNA maturation endonuclease Nob1